MTSENEWIDDAIAISGQNPHPERETGGLCELRAFAEAATPKRWKPFWGDAVQAVMCARSDREVVFWSGFDSSRTATTKGKRIALMNYIAAVTCAVALLWWGAWCFHALRGWTAFPIGFTVGGVIYGIGALCIFAAANVESDQ